MKIQRPHVIIFLILQIICFKNEPLKAMADLKRLPTPKILRTHSKADPSLPEKTGLFKVTLTGGHYLFEIPDSLFGREMMVVTRFIRTPFGITVDGEQYGGQKENSQVWKWERRNKQVLIRVHNYSISADSGSAISQAVQNSNLDAILYAFPIQSVNRENHTVTVDVSDFYNGDIPATGVSNEIRKAYKITALDNSRSYIDTIKSFPGNIETRVVKTYRSGDSPSDKSLGSITFELNNSMLLLPKEPMKARIYDPRVSYFSAEHTDYSSTAQRADVISYIKRWRLEPKDSAAYAAGILTEPKKQIIFYVDPATPQQWVPYIIKGINDWQIAFEAAGFKNAIIGKPAPTKEEDPEFSTEDARYNVIRYFASDIENANGPCEADPRSGEIIESHVMWYHNQIKQLHDWYLIQTAAANPLARKAALTDDQMGELIRYTISHEVGHTLGLPHNWGASFAYPVDSLRSKSFTDRHGTAPSIMDYSRFNYVAQPGDGVTQYSPRIGEYDLWTIKWGYTWFPGHQTVQTEKRRLDKWTRAKGNDPLYFFGRNFTNYDPRTQSEDIGNDAFKAGRYGIANLKQELPNLEKWISVPGRNEDDLKDLYNQLIGQYYLYIDHAITYVGGMYVTFKTADQPFDGFTYVTKRDQEKAITFLNQYIFRTPNWLMDKHELNQFDNGVVINTLKTLQVKTLRKLLNPSRLVRMYDNELKNGKSAYSPADLFHELSADLFANVQPDLFERNLQRGYIEILAELLNNDFASLSSTTDPPRADAGYTPIDVTLSDVRPEVRSVLKSIYIKLENGTTASKDHRDDLRYRIRDALSLHQLTMVK